MSELINRDDVIFLITRQREALLEAAEGEASHHADVLRDMAAWWKELADAVKKLAPSLQLERVNTAYRVVIVDLLDALDECNRLGPDHEWTGGATKKLYERAREAKEVLVWAYAALPGSGITGSELPTRSGGPAASAPSCDR
jgi:hypothetical protein